MKGDEVKEVLDAAVAEASDRSGILMGNVGPSSAEMLNCLIAIFLLDPVSENFDMTTRMTACVQG
eukprot:768351-Hanusia_phi.AAC.10